MPVILGSPIRRLEQQEFSDVAYRVMAVAFDVHRDFGRLFDEKVYQTEIAMRLGNADCEVPIEARFQAFRKVYYIDLVVDSSAIFELKTVESLVPRHRSQLLNYLLMAGACHGKLINMRPEKIQHEFCNTTLTHADRTCFAVEDRFWDHGPAYRLKEWLIEFLRDVGVGLDLSLYEEAAAFHCKTDVAFSRIEITSASGISMGNQDVQLATPDVAIKFSSYSDEHLQLYENHLLRFLQHTKLIAIQWINLNRNQILFKTLIK